MPIRFAPWFVAALCSGCSLILDTGDLPKAPDAPPPPDAPPIDGNRMAFTITGVWPDSPELLEGAGAKGIPLVLRFTGTNIIDPVVTAKFADTSDPIEVTEYHSSTTLDDVAVGLRIPVRPDLSVASCGATPVNIHFDFDQSGSTPAGFDVPLHCLDELDDLANFVSGNLYSQITIGTMQHYGGTSPPVFTATGDITITSVIDVDASGLTAGPGGCDGGAAGNPGDCGGGGAQGAGGGTLNPGGGGGGGGFSVDGLAGGGESNGGLHQGNPMLVPLGTAVGTLENRGAGGGGGGQGTVGSPGAGGGGGGVITLVAGGEIHVGTSALIRAKGDNGGPGGGGLGLASGGGGGGSGGGILIRSGAGVVYDDSATAWLHAPNGGGGTSPGNAGGAGAVGRIRVDQPVASPSVGGMAMAGSIATGPAWSATTVPFSTDGTISLQLYVTPGTYGILLDGQSLPDNGGNVLVNTSPATVQIHNLQHGYNRVCALYDRLPDAGALTERDEAKTCVTVVYTPGS